MTQIFYPTRPTAPFVTNVYDTLGRIQTQTNANNETWIYYFSGSRSEEIDPDGESKIRYQDAFGKPLRLIDELNREVVNRCDGQNRIISSKQPEGNTIAYSYDDATCGTDRCSHNVLSITEKAKPGSSLAPLTQGFSYDPGFGKILSSTDARGATTDYSYDAQTGELLSVTLPPDQGDNRPQRTFAYASLSSTLGGNFTLLGSQTDKISVTESSVTTYGYEVSNHFALKTVTVDAGGLNLVTTSTYDSIGNLKKIDGPRTDLSDITSYNYDAERRLITTTDVFGLETRNTYDADGQLVRLATQLDTTWQVTCTRYTPTQHIRKIWGPSKMVAPDQCPEQTSPVAVKDYQYDAVDRLSLVTDELPDTEGGARLTQTEYYPDGKTHRIIRDFRGPLQQNFSTFTYTANGQAKTVADAAGNVTTYEYDGFDRLQSTRFPQPASAGQSSSSDRDDFSYDANGNLKTWQRRSGETIQYTYDNLNRIIEKQLPVAADNVSYSYDLLSRLTAQTMANTAQDIVFDYDKASRVEAVSQGTRTVSYQYDPAGNRTRMTWPDGFFVNYGYDAANRMETINEQATTALASYEYNKQYLRKLATLGNGTTTTYSYTNQSRLMTLNHDLTGTENDVTLSHNYNQVGQLVSRATSNNLFDWQTNTTTKTTYDANGLNQYTTIDGVAQQHDGNGNLEDDGNWMLEFDEENWLISATNTDVSVAYQYDAEGRRLEKDHNGAVKQYLYDGADLIGVYDNAGNLIQRYVHGPGVDEPLVGYDYDSQGVQQAKRWYYANHQGSVIATADAAGDVDQIYTYSSFGVPGEQAPPQFGYTGQVWDEETGLAYYRARYFSPERGRFLSADPAGYLDSMNLYAYTSNDPVNSRDPTGLCPSCVGAFVSVATGVGIRALTGGDVLDLGAIMQDAALGAVGAGFANKISTIRQLTRVKNAKFPNGVIGKIGERLAGTLGGKTKILSRTKTATRRFPDKIDELSHKIIEVKNKVKLTNGDRNQILDSILEAESRPGSFTTKLLTRGRATNTSVVQDLVNTGRLSVSKIPRINSQGVANLSGGTSAGIGVGAGGLSSLK